MRIRFIIRIERICHFVSQLNRRFSIITKYSCDRRRIDADAIMYNAHVFRFITIRFSFREYMQNASARFKSLPHASIGDVRRFPELKEKSDKSKYRNR